MVLASSGAAQSCCDSGAVTCGQTYRLVYQTVCEQRQVTAYRIEYENVCEERQVTAYKPVWETAVRENRYTVARPVYETAEREETYTVMKPVYETAEREECYTVMRPVYETSCRTEYHTVMQPVTTLQTRFVDRGCFAEQMVLKPGLPATRLTWQSAGCAVDPATGQTVYQRPGLYWSQTPRGRYEVQRVWQPNVIAEQVPQVSYVPQTVARQIPVQVCKYVPERVVRKVPYQVCRMVAEQQTVRVPRTVEKRIPVTYTYNVPRLVCYRIPLDACGEPIGQPATMAAPSSSAVMESPRQPTPVAPTKQPSTSADVKPELGPQSAMPQPVEADDHRSPSGLAPVPPFKSEAPSSEAYAPKNR